MNDVNNRAVREFSEFLNIIEADFPKPTCTTAYEITMKSTIVSALITLDTEKQMDERFWNHLRVQRNILDFLYALWLDDDRTLVDEFSTIIKDLVEYDSDSDNSAQTATRSDRKVVSTNGMDTYSELSGEISVDVNSYEFGEMPESTKEYYLSYGSDFKTAWLNAMYTDVYEYSGKYSNLDALSRFIEYLKFYDEATDYMEVEGMIQDLHEIWYDFDIETLTEEDAGVYVDRVIQMAEANGAEIQIW